MEHITKDNKFKDHLNYIISHMRSPGDQTINKLVFLMKESAKLQNDDEIYKKVIIECVESVSRFAMLLRFANETVVGDFPSPSENN